MEHDKNTCTRCYKTKEISLFQTIDGKPRKTCNQCRKYSSANDAKRRETKLNSFKELEKPELKESVLSENENQGVQL